MTEFEPTEPNWTLLYCRSNPWVVWSLVWNPAFAAMLGEENANRGDKQYLILATVQSNSWFRQGWCVVAREDVWINCEWAVPLALAVPDAQCAGVASGTPMSAVMSDNLKGEMYGENTAQSEAGGTAGKAGSGTSSGNDPESGSPGGTSGASSPAG